MAPRPHRPKPACQAERDALVLLLSQRVRRGIAGEAVDRRADPALQEISFVLRLRDEIAARRSALARRTR